jgi:hypothetical protein
MLRRTTLGAFAFISLEAVMLTEDPSPQPIAKSPDRVIHLAAGLASPLWPTFLATAGVGVAYWWWARWANFEHPSFAGEGAAVAAPTTSEYGAFATEVAERTGEAILESQAAVAEATVAAVEGAAAAAEEFAESALEVATETQPTVAETATDAVEETSAAAEQVADAAVETAESAASEVDQASDQAAAQAEEAMEVFAPKPARARRIKPIA